VASFEGVGDEYDAARPSYPAGVFDAIGPLRGVRVLDIGAGTGIATRQLRDHGAAVIAVDRGRGLLARAVAHTPELPVIVADGTVLPVSDTSVDLVCFAQAWHWLDERTRCREAHRVLRNGGRWAAWWSHARADTEDWFDHYWSAIEVACPGTHRDQRDTDWGAGVSESGLFSVGDRIVVPWWREVSTADWLTDQASHSYVAGLPEADRRHLLTELRTIIDQRFPDGSMKVPYETWAWVGQKV
jgi:SAM-dependent methyltransferase